MTNNQRYRIAVRGFIAKGDQFLLLERAKPARGEMGYWELPGGGLDFGESPQCALIREIDEETQIQVEVKQPVSAWHYTRDNAVQIIGITFLCQWRAGDIVLSDEHLSYQWLSMEQIKQKKIFPEFLEELKAIKL